jgi:hypothetical protein
MSEHDDIDDEAVDEAIDGLDDEAYLFAHSDEDNNDDDDDDLDDDDIEHELSMDEDEMAPVDVFPLSQHDEVATTRQGARGDLMRRHTAPTDMVKLVGDSEEDLNAFEYRLLHDEPSMVTVHRVDASATMRALNAVRYCTSVTRLALVSTGLPCATLFHFLTSQSHIASLSFFESAYGDELLFRLAGYLSHQTVLTHLHFSLFTLGDIAMRVFVESSPRYQLRSLWLENAHFRFGASAHLAPLVLLCGSLRELRIVGVNLFEFDVRNVLHSVALRRDFQSLSLARKSVVDSEAHEVVDLNRADYLDFLGRTAGVYGASLTRLDLLGQAFTTVAQRKLARRLRDNVSLLSLGRFDDSRWSRSELHVVQRILDRNRRIIWRDVLPMLVGFALAMSPLELSVFVMINIFDYWFDDGHHIAWHLKWKVIANVNASRRRLKSL